MDLPRWDACILEPALPLRWVECHPGTAAWVAAIGVLVTVIVSAVIALRQRSQALGDEKRREQVAKNQLLADVARLVFQIAQFLQGFPGWVDDGERGRIPATDTRPDKAMVLSWLLYESRFNELDDYGMIEDVSDLRARIHRISELLNKEPPVNGPDNFAQQRRVDAGNIARLALIDCANFQRRHSDYRARGGPPEDS